MALATLNGETIARANVLVPAWGLWWGDIDLAGDATFDVGTAATLVIADVTAACHVVAGGSYEGRASYRVVAGAGGWSREIAKTAYTNDAGVKASKVLADAANAVGESVSDLPTTLLGPHYTRPAGLASAVLHALASRAWYVGFDAVTRFGSRPESVYTGDGTRTRVDKSVGVYEIVTDSIAELLPGVTVDGSTPAIDIEYVLDASRLSARVYTAAPTSRRLRAFAAILDALDPRRRFRGVFEYRVVNQSGERLNLQAARASTAMPDLTNVPVRPGMAGLRANVTPGELVLVAFADADPSRPNVISHAAPDAPGWMPLILELGGPSALGIARVTDPVIAGPLAGTIVSGSLRVKASL